MSTNSENMILFFFDGSNLLVTLSIMPWVTMAFSILGLKNYATNYLAWSKVRAPSSSESYFLNKLLNYSNNFSWVFTWVLHSSLKTLSGVSWLKLVIILNWSRSSVGKHLKNKFYASLWEMVYSVIYWNSPFKLSINFMCSS